jgi:hypothetical protein
MAEKAAFKHGELGKWLEANASVLGFGQRQAENLMAADRKHEIDCEYEGEKLLEVHRSLWGGKADKPAEKGKAGSTTKAFPNYSKAVKEVLGEPETIDHDLADTLEMDCQRLPG